MMCVCQWASWSAMCTYWNLPLPCLARARSLSPGAVCIAPPSFYLISPLCSLAKSHKSHRPSWRGFLRLRPNSPLLGTAFESLEPYLNLHVSVCERPKALEGGHSQLVLFHGRDLHTGLEERRSLTNLFGHL